MGTSSLRQRRSSPAVLLGGNLAQVFDALVAELPQAVMVADLDGLVVHWNAAAEELLGWSAEEAVGQPLAQLRAHARNGSAVTLTMSSSEVIDADGATVATVVTATPPSDLEWRARDLLARAGEIVSITDAAGYVRYVSPEIARLRGIDPSDLVGRHGLEFAHPDDHAALDEARERVLASPDEHPVVVYRSLVVDGAVRWSETTYSNYLDDPVIAGIVMNVRDVTQREEAYRLLSAQEDRMSAILERSADVAVMFTLDGRIEWISPAVASAFGLDPRDLAGSAASPLVVMEDRARVRGALAEAIDTGRPARVEFGLVDGSGATRSVEAIISDLTDDPSVGCLVANLRDVTERSEMLRSLAAERDRQRAIVGQSSDVVMFFRPDFTIEWVSPAARHVFGVAPDELVGRSGVDLIHPDDRDRCIADFATMTGLGDHATTEFRYVDVEGRVRWIEEVATNLIDDPSVGFVVGNVRDITERKLAHDELRLQAHILDSVGQAIVAVDEGRRVIYWNHAATALYGWTADEAEGRRVGELIVPSEGWEARATEVIDEIQAGGTWSGEFSVQRRDGSVVPVLVTDTPIRDETGELIGWIGASVDLTERKASEAVQARLSAIVTSSHDAILSKTLDGIVTTWNEAAAALFGYRPDEVIGRHVSMLVPPDRRDEVDHFLDVIRGGGTVRDFETRRRRADGTEFAVSLSISPIFDAAGTVVAASTTARDVSERVELMWQLEQDRRRLREAQASAQLGSFEVELPDGETAWSDELFHLLGLPPGAPHSLRSFLDRIHPDDRAVFASCRSAAIADRRGADCELRIVRPSGEVRWAAVQMERREAGAILSGTLLDITVRKAAEDALAHRAHHDPLTGLPNRSLLDERLDGALRAQQRDLTPVAVALLDLDQFKMINDGLGHAVGDEVLVAVANRLQAAAAPGDTVARFGGDEFVVIRSGHLSSSELVSFAEDLRAAIGAPVAVRDHEFHLTASVGVTLSRPDNTAVELLRDADCAMYDAKGRGRDRTQVCDDGLRGRIRGRLDTAADLRIGLERQELWVAYQPVVSFQSGSVVGFEALVRWNHPERGLVSPAEFIPIAEETGLIEPLGRWVLFEALGQLARWRVSHERAQQLWMAVNLSATQLQRPSVVEMVTDAIGSTEVPPHLVHLEITESVLMDDVDQSIARLDALHRLGTHLSIDDFGTGYSSLSYLKQLPVGTLKVDQSFVSGIGHDVQDRSIVEAIVALGRALDLEVLAEGVETSTQAETLAELGCDLGQGYLWSRPLPPEDVMSAVRRLGLRPSAR